MVMAMEPKRFHFFTLLAWAWLHLHLVLFYGSADAQSAIQPAPSFATRRGWDPSFALMVAALTCALLFMAFFSVYLRHCAESYNAAHNRNGAAGDWSCSCPQGIKPELLKTFPIFVYSAVKDLKIGKGVLECAVCLGEFKDQETLRLLPKCSHVFHSDCIDGWLASHITCPLCRCKLSTNTGEIAIAMPTQLDADQLDDENSVRIEVGELEQHQRPVEYNENIDQNRADETNGKPKSRKLGMLVRSNSTGHSLVEPGKNLDRYTLRLPEEVRKRILVDDRRCAIYHLEFPREGISQNPKRLCWSDNEGSSRDSNNSERQGGRLNQWVLLRTPPFGERKIL